MASECINEPALRSTPFASVFSSTWKMLQLCPSNSEARLIDLMLSQQVCPKQQSVAQSGTGTKPIANVYNVYTDSDLVSLVVSWTIESAGTVVPHHHFCAWLRPGEEYLE